MIPLKNNLKQQPSRQRPNRWQRSLSATLRDTYLLIREFGWPLLYFSLAICGGGLLYHALAQMAGQPMNSIVQAIYLVLGLTFLEANGEFPNIWYLQLFYFLMPIIGIGILAQGLADFGLLFFNRRARSKEWEMAVASTYTNHIILIGLGHLGYRVAKQLHEFGQQVVAITLDPRADTLASTQAMHIPVIQDDGQRETVLRAAGVEKAQAIVVCTQNDGLNLQIAFKARSLNPTIRVVLRIFDDYLAQTLHEKFGFHALSATQMGAPSFASAAAGVDITQPITVAGESLSLASLDIKPASRLVGLAVADLEQRYNVSVVLLRRDTHSEFHPAGTRYLAVNDLVAVFGGPLQISRLINDNK